MYELSQSLVLFLDLQSRNSIRTSPCSLTSTPPTPASTCRAGRAAAAPSLLSFSSSAPKAPGPGRACAPTPRLISSSPSCVRPPGMSWRWRRATAPAVGTRAPSLPRWIMMAVSPSTQSFGYNKMTWCECAISQVTQWSFSTLVRMYKYISSRACKTGWHKRTCTISS